MKNTIKGFAAGVIMTSLLTTSIVFAADGEVQKKIDVVMNKVKLQVNNQFISVPNILYNGKTYVPLREVADALDKEISWDGVNYTVKITDKKNEITVETKAITNKTEYLETDLKIPVIRGMKNTKLQETINTKLESEAVNFNNKLAKEGKNSIEESKKNNWPLRPYGAMITYEVGYNRNNIISLPITYWEYTGGAHGNYRTVATNIDLKTGNNLALKDIFKPGTDFKKIISQEIKRQMEIEQDKLFASSVTSFTIISDDQKYYLDSDGLVFYFDPYEIAPYAAGTVEFKIKFSQIKDLLNENIL